MVHAMAHPNELKTFSLRIPAELDAKLEALARDDARSKNNLVTRILTQVVEERAKELLRMGNSE